MVATSLKVSRYEVARSLNILEQPFSDVGHYVGVETLGVLELQPVEDGLHVFVV